MSYRNDQHRLAAFEERMAVAREVAKENPQGLLSLVRLIGRRLQADTIAQVVELATHRRRSNPEFDILFFESSIPLTSDGRRFDDLVRQKRGPFYQLQLGRDLILPIPWHKDRIANALANIGFGKRCGPWKAERNHQVELYLPFGLVLVNGGNHSLTAGIVNGEGSVINNYTLDMEPVYEHVRYNGISYVRIFDGSEIKRHPDPDIGSIYEIGRLMLERGVNFDGVRTTKKARDTQEKFDIRTSNCRYRVFCNGKIEPYEATVSAVEHFLSRAKIKRESKKWHAALHEGAEVVWDHAGRPSTWRFEIYLETPLLEHID